MKSLDLACDNIVQTLKNLPQDDLPQRRRAHGGTSSREKEKAAQAAFFCFYSLFLEYQGWRIKLPTFFALVGL
jgi:hypothetical protein